MIAKIAREELVYLGAIEGTPLGIIWVALSERGLVSIEIQGALETIKTEVRRRGFSRVSLTPDKLTPAVRQLEDYFKGARQSFDLPIDWSIMTPFQAQALHATCAIPYGQVTTYGALARQIGRPRAARAVGRAEATNPVPLVIPCHRVLGADGGLHGYGAPGGLATKAWLLRHEGYALI